MTGELFRGFLKHKIFGTVVAVERDEMGTVLASTEIHEAIACKHRLAGYALTLEGAKDLTAHARDWETFDPVCADPTHLLADIGAASLAVQLAEVEWQRGHAHAKALKETFEEKTAELRQIVRDSTDPPRLPLFATPAPGQP